MFSIKIIKPFSRYKMDIKVKVINLFF